MTLVGTIPQILQASAQGSLPKFIYQPSITGYERRFLVTTQEASPGGSMGALVDLSGNGGAPLTGVNQPTMRLEGNSYYAELDGVNDFIAAAGDATKKARTTYTLQRVRSLPVAPKYLWLISTSELVLFVNTDNQLFIRNLTNSKSTGTGLFVTIGKWHVFSLLNNGNTVLVSLDGVETTLTLTGLVGNAGNSNVGTTSTAPNSGAVDFKEWIMWPLAQGYSTRQGIIADMRAAHNI